LTESVHFVVPGTPRGQERAGIGRVSGRAVVFTRPQTRSETGAIRMFASTAMAGRPPMEGPLEMRLLARYPIPQSWSKKNQERARKNEIKPTLRPDLDNIEKLCLDSMNFIVWKDDAQIVRLYAEKQYSETPNVEIYVAQVE